MSDWNIANRKGMGVPLPSQTATVPQCDDVATTRRNSVEVNELIYALQEALEFIEDYEDVLDGDYGMPKPNKAMQLASIVREALRSAGVEP